MPEFKGTDGRSYRTGAELARGGEGVIYRVVGAPDLLIKHYLPGHATPEREAKLKAMLANPPVDEMLTHFQHPSITWPRVLLHEQRRFAGYVMPRVHDGVSLLNAFNPRAAHYLGLDWHGLHRVAKNLCTAVQAVHAKGYVIGDLNQLNVLVTARGLVSLVDTDSFQVSDGAEVHRCPVGVPEYTPAELHGCSLSQVDRTPAHDCFALAVLVFQLLMDGHHPFSGAMKNPQDSVDKVDEWCIRNGVFPYLDDPRVGRPPAARGLDQLDPDLAALFKRCFISGYLYPALRPAPSEWSRALDRAEGRLVRCAADSHWRMPGNEPCHACARASRRPGAAARTPTPPAPPGPMARRPARGSAPRTPPRPTTRRPAATPPRPAGSSPRRQRRLGRRLALALLTLSLLAVGSGALGWFLAPPSLVARAAARAPGLVLHLGQARAASARARAARAHAAGDQASAAAVLAEAAAWDALTAPLAPSQPRSGPVGTIAAGMVLIPGGEFLIGCSAGDTHCEADEQPAHRVRVAPFRINRYEVTQAQWSAVMGTKPARVRGDDHPVENISWDEVQRFLQRLNAQRSAKPYRLPTEAEWEFAARAGTATPWWWGADPGRGRANCDGCGGGPQPPAPGPVGSFRANGLGLYDTAGNVREWVADCWRGPYRQAPASAASAQAACPAFSGRIDRGGGWDSRPDGTRVSYRHWQPADYRSGGIGFRLAQDI